MQRRWSHQQLAQHMRIVAVDHDGTASLDSLKIMISKWENDRLVPGEYNRRLLAETLGVPVEDLGLTVDPDFVW
jgi:transcriptional regulator with XRE-family HTH domain